MPPPVTVALLSTRSPVERLQGLMNPSVIVTGRFGAMPPFIPKRPPETITAAPSPGVGHPVSSTKFPSRTSNVTPVHVLLKVVCSGPVFTSVPSPASGMRRCTAQTWRSVPPDASTYRPRLV